MTKQPTRRDHALWASNRRETRDIGAPLPKPKIIYGIFDRYAIAAPYKERQS